MFFHPYLHRYQHLKWFDNLMQFVYLEILIYFLLKVIIPSYLILTYKHLEREGLFLKSDLFEYYSKAVIWVDGWFCFASFM